MAWYRPWKSGGLFTFSTRVVELLPGHTSTDDMDPGFTAHTQTHRHCTSAVESPVVVSYYDQCFLSLSCMHRWTVSKYCCGYYQVCAHTRIHARTRMHAHTHTHTHIHIHTHTPACMTITHDILTLMYRILC